ncbi:MAG: hypothetical protein ACI9IV_001840 [Paracoccaceae bacterium]|jgi:hypothetical protein
MLSIFAFNFKLAGSVVHAFLEISSLQRRTGSLLQGSSPFGTLRTQDMAIEKTVASASIAEVVDRILDKGVVIDAFVRISLVGIELISIEVRAVVASVETWLKYAEAVGLTVDPAAA